MAKPDIQQLLRRHVFGTEAQKRRIDEAMAGVKVTNELAREAALKGLACVKAGNVAEARKAQAEADKWWKLCQTYRAKLN